MTPDQRDLLESAAQSLDAASLLHREGYHAFAASRAYYAMFYIAESFLEGLGLSFSKHSAVIAAFGQHVAQKGIVPVLYHRRLIEAYDLRQTADYSAPKEVTAGQSQAVIEQCRDFLQLARKLLDPG